LLEGRVSGGFPAKF